MKLLASTTSPFVRKITVLALELGIELDIDWIVTTVLKPNPKVGEKHPLIKIPTLVTDDGMSLYDSRVIAEYLMHHAGMSLGPDRFAVLRTQALSDGILDAAVLVFYERMFRAEELRSQPWMDAQSDKARRGLAELEATTETWARTADAFDLGQIAVATMLGWVDFRDVLPGARAAQPKLFAWYDAVKERPSMLATVPRAPQT